MVLNLFQGPQFAFSRISEPPGPKDTAHIKQLSIVNETIALRKKRGNFFAMNKIERIDFSSTMSMGTHRIDVSKQTSVFGAIPELSWRV